jgi:hypothetical protein
VISFIPLLLLFSNEAHAQIADASFFPSVKSINPGIAHLRSIGFLALDLGKRNIEKKHEVDTGGIVGGINTDVDLKKGTLFAAGKGKIVNFEALIDQESGEKVEKIKNPTRGDRTITNEASSMYYGGILDLYFVGVSLARANYEYTDKFRVGEVPDVTARDQQKDLSYSALRMGSAFKVKGITLGGYLASLKGEGEWKYTYYDPSTGNRGSTEKFDVETSAKGYGFGLGYTASSFRFETSLEKMYDTKLDVPDDYPQEITEPTDSSRLSLVAEMRLKLFSFGIRVRQISGNYFDLEDIISSNLLYGEMREEDKRLETSFNFSLGSSKGLTYSAFYTQSETETNEKDPIFDPDQKFDAVTKAKAMGVNISYIF